MVRLCFFRNPRFKLRSGKSHKFASEFRVADVEVSVDVKRQCPKCAPVTIRTISLDLQASKTWNNVGNDVVKSAASTAGKHVSMSVLVSTL